MTLNDKSTPAERTDFAKLVSITNAVAVVVVAVFFTDRVHSSEIEIEYKITSAENYNPADNVKIDFYLKNSSIYPLKILKWYTPLEPISGHILTVFCDGEYLAYEGPMIKRNNPSESDFLIINPNETVHKKGIDISNIYDFRHIRGKLCTVDFKSERLKVQKVREKSLLARSQLSKITVNGAPAKFNIR